MSSVFWSLVPVVKAGAQNLPLQPDRCPMGVPRLDHPRRRARRASSPGRPSAGHPLPLRVQRAKANPCALRSDTPKQFGVKGQSLSGNIAPCGPTTYGDGSGLEGTSPGLTHGTPDSPSVVSPCGTRELFPDSLSDVGTLGVMQALGIPAEVVDPIERRTLSLQNEGENRHGDGAVVRPAQQLDRRLAHRLSSGLPCRKLCREPLQSLPLCAICEGRFSGKQSLLRVVVHTHTVEVAGSNPAPPIRLTD
jgi:hypothetical protein